MNKITSEQVMQIVGWVAQATADFILRKDTAAVFSSVLQIIEILGLKNHAGDLLGKLIVSSATK